MVFKDERGDNSYFPDDLDHKCLLIARSESIQGSWEMDSDPISPTTISVDQSNDKNLWAEGPSVFWNNSTSEWWVFFEYFRSMKYGVLKSKDGIHWINQEDQLHLPPNVKHGTVFEVNDEDILQGLSQFQPKE